MTRTANIPAANRGVVLPEWEVNGRQMAWIGYKYATRTLQEHYTLQCTLRALPEHSQSTPRQYNTNTGATRYGITYHPEPFVDKSSPGWAGQPIIHQLKTTIMATTASSKGVSADRIKNDPVFERTRENAAEFTRAGKAAFLLWNFFLFTPIYSDAYLVIGVTLYRLYKQFSP